jgi:hypothetical protein
MKIANLYVRYISGIKKNKNKIIIKIYLTLEWLSLTHEVMIHLTEVDLL